MGDFFQRTRVDIARRNLDRIVELENTVKNRTTELSGLSEDIAAASGATSEFWDMFYEQRRLWRGKAPTATELNELLSSIDKAVGAIDDAILKATERAQRMRSAYLVLPGDRKDVADLVERAKAMRASLDVIRYGGDGPGCEALFADYVEILRGVALRDAGLAEKEYTLADLLRLAEALPDLWGRQDGKSWLSVVVPGLAESSESSVALLLRMGFPEWTYWALPLVLHDFAHVWLTWAGARQPDAAVNAALADAAATLMMGPAYGCAALVMRLEPGTARDPGSVDALRAATILASLKRVADRFGAPLAGLVKRLRQEWVDAVAAAGGDGGAMDRLVDAPAVAALTQQAIDVAPAAARPNGDRPRWAASWGTVSTWSTALRDGDALAKEGIGTDSAEGLVMTMNAAWLCRFAMDAADDVADRAELDRIAGDAMTWSLQLLDAVGRRNAQRGGDGRGTNVRGN